MKILFKNLLNIIINSLYRYLKIFHEDISCILIQNDVYDLYRKINSKFKEILRERIAKMNIINNGGPQHGFVKINFANL